MEVVTQAYQTGIHQIVSDLFVTMLATEVSPAAEHSPSDKDHITALISFAGTWRGMLEFECGREEAIHFAKRFLQMDDIHECNDDVRDTVGELTNIIAGNLKALLPSDVKLGMPSITSGGNYTVHISGGTLVGQRTFTTDIGTFSIRLIEDTLSVGGGQ